MTEAQYFPTTIDNPNNPLVDWDAWFAYENANGHQTLQLIDKYYFGSSNISESLDDFMWNDAVDTILNYFPWYIKVKKDTQIKPVPIKIVQDLMKMSKKEA